MVCTRASPAARPYRRVEPRESRRSRSWTMAMALLPATRAVGTGLVPAYLIVVIVVCPYYNSRK